VKRKYETVVILDGSLPDETVTSEQEKIEAFLKKNSDYEKTDIWGKRTLCYDINKKNIGFYIFFVYDGENDVPEKLQKSFRLNQKILRHMTVLYEKKAEISRDIIKKRTDVDRGEE
jgi:small subunit ribosomal protein S6